ncbi:MAG TPA: hypothetical protein VEV84_01425 [Pyrinomonadaceae bacterium]|nr:hypothetical protein [Pyrinomonadaceae bacterium]
MLRVRRFALETIVILAFVMVVVSTARAQATPGEEVQSKSSDPFREAIERRNREIGLRSITMIGSQKRDPREQQALLEQMNDDFKEIQLIRLAMVKDIADGKQFEYKRLADDASEIKKRAARLRSSLALLEDKEIERPDPKKVEYEKDTIQDAASDLCLEISRFITNPLFKPGAVYNLRYAVEADNTLDNVINLSTNIRNSADRLRRVN